VRFKESNHCINVIERDRGLPISIKNDLKLSDREYICKKCEIILDRDKNASINLKNAKIFQVV